MTPLNRCAALLSNGLLTAAQFPWHIVREPHLRDLVAALKGDGLSITEVNLTLGKLRRVFKSEWRQGRLETAEMLMLLAVPDLPRTQLLHGYELPIEHLKALLRRCNHSRPIGARDAALIVLVYEVHLTYPEIASLSLSDLRPFRSGDFQITCRCTADGRARRVKATGGSAYMLHRWIDARGGMPGPLFQRLIPPGRVPEESDEAFLIFDTATRLKDRMFEIARQSHVRLFQPALKGYTGPR